MVMILGIDFSPYFFWALGLIVVVIIYFLISEEDRHQVNLFLKKYGAWMFLIILWFFFYLNNIWGEFHYGSFFNHVSTFIAICLAFLILTFQTIIARERYLSTHAICDNRSGSCAKYEQKGDYIIMSIGTTDKDLNIEAGHESWVVPKRHFSKINNKPNSARTQIVVKTNVQKCELIEVPGECYDGLVSGKYNTDEVYYGEYSVEELECGEKIKGFSPSQIMMRMKENQRMLNETRNNLKTHSSASKRFLSDLSLMGKKSKGEHGYNVNPNPTTEQ